MTKYYVFMGWDSSEKDAYAVAKHTLIKNSSVPIEVIPLDHMKLRSQGLFTREWETKADGQTVCKVDNKPFSTQFSHSRFLVPELWRHISDPNKSSLALFVDPDFVFLGDIGDLFRDIELHKKIKGAAEAPIYCVKHEYKPTEEKKMHGVQQSKYSFKLWSAFMIFNLEHPDCQNLTADVVNTWDGRALHTFEWVEDVHKIEHVAEDFHYVPNHSEGRVSYEDIKAIHYTEGGPWFKDYLDCKYADIWNGAFEEYLNDKISRPKINVRDIVLGD